MLNCFANASNFSISNSTFNQVTGVQNNFNISNPPSASTCDALTRLVIAANGLETTESDIVDQHSGNHMQRIGEMRRWMEFVAGMQKQNLEKSGSERVPRASVERSAASHRYPNPQIRDIETSPIRPRATSNNELYYQEHQALTQKTIITDNRTSHLYSSPPFSHQPILQSPENSTSPTTKPSHRPSPSSNLASPHQSTDPVSQNTHLRRGHMPLQADSELSSDYSIAPLNPYGSQELRHEPNFQPCPPHEAHRTDGVPCHVWFEENRLVQSPPPIPQDNQSFELLGHLPYTPSSRHYATYPPPNFQMQHLDQNTQLEPEFYPAHSHESYSDSRRSTHSDILPLHHRTSLGPYHYVPSTSDCAYHQHALRVPPPADRGGMYVITPDVRPPFPENSYYTIP